MTPGKSYSIMYLHMRFGKQNCHGHTLRFVRSLKNPEQVRSGTACQVEDVTPKMNVFDFT